ncbi:MULTISPECIES: cytochrome-c peroxidase [unclassified Siphonobacter]|uniref:cytochrome-c peroxidase n=1 Tax=unclassified Siphonobacter TaxID=2635712 RepID=UPI000CC0C1D0|nr:MULTISPECIES: cytochrome c peroxidase [unclassified Siphonobacter]MDQ1090170.1 cytochrome c peroxidase [Siphonobacter sp. SORGH_AS_1065]PKK37262.1 cytochrome-c peroxidase [Siphonobacter sp. SORGH_AS_0500]
MKVFFLALGGILLLFLNFRFITSEEPLSKVELGKKLFFDPILSEDRTISCASCHKPEFAFADTMSFSLGVRNTPGERNTPSAMNLAGRLQLFWDGRSSSLEMQALEPIANPTEMNLPIAEAVSRLNGDKFYAKAFRKLYKSDVTATQLAEVIAAYERTLETSNTPYDRYINGDDAAMSASAIRGRNLFIGKANCANCHSGEDFTADRFKNIGLFDGKDLLDQGRFRIVKDSTYLGHFKVPGLRNVALTAPYMHNGMFKTLREVINYYNHPDQFVKNGFNRDPSLSTPLNLSEGDITDLEAFLHALTDDQFTKK